jgi:hypothetical protein
MVGTRRADVLRGTPRADVIAGLGGNDLLVGGGGNDVICGGRGKDVVAGGDGDDRLFGGRGSDAIHGGPGDDRLLGGRGDDWLDGGGGTNSIRGGEGTDTCQNARTRTGCERRGDSEEPIPDIDSPEPVRAPEESSTENRFDIELLNFDLPPASAVIHRWTFRTADGWEFFDRVGYHCAFWFLQVRGQRAARVVVRDVGEGSTYPGINDRFGKEQPEDRSTCALPLGPPGFEEEKPPGLQDGIVTFFRSGVPVATMVFPATSPLSRHTWFEFEDQGPNHIRAEGYWDEEGIFVIDIDRMSAAITMAAT